jgi:hypothetical protein
MKTLTHTQDAEQIKFHLFGYILDCIDGEGYDRHLFTPSVKLQFLMDCFKSEFCHPYEVKRHRGNVVSILAEWIAGLPSAFTVDFQNYDILQLGKKFGMLPSNPTEEQEDEMLQNFFRTVAEHTIELMKINGINTSV